MKFKRIFIIIIGILVFSSSCTQGNNSTKMESSEVKFLKDYVILFQNKNYDEIKKAMNPQLLNQQLQSNLEQIAKIIPNESPKNILLVRNKTIKTFDNVKTILTLQYEFSSVWLIANIVIEKKENGQYIVNNFNVNPLNDSLANMNKFSLNNKTPFHYIIFFLASIVPIFILVSLFFCIRTPMEKKWLWIIFMLLGVGKFSFNWTDSNFNFEIISIQLFGSGFVRTDNLGPWIISTSMPIGAILFWIKRSRFKSIFIDENIAIDNNDSIKENENKEE